MKAIKSSINVKYVIEVKDLNGSSWTPFAYHDILREAIQDIEEERETLPKCQFRLIRSVFKKVL